MANYLSYTGLKTVLDAIHSYITSGTHVNLSYNTTDGIKLTGAGAGNIKLSAGTGIKTTYSSGGALTFAHTNSVPAGNIGGTTSSTKTASAGTAFSIAVPYFTYDAQGHITTTRGFNTYNLTIPTVPSIPNLSLGNKSGTGNAITALSVSGHQITATYGSTFVTSTEFNNYKNATASALIYKGSYAGDISLTFQESTYADGTVVSVGTKEYVAYNGKWIELGDEGIYALNSSNLTSGNNAITVTNSNSGNKLSYTITHKTASHTAPANLSSSVTLGNSMTLLKDLTTDAWGHVTGYTTHTVSVSHNTPSGATAGSTSPSSQQTPSHGGTFNIPVITTDAYGHVTNKSTTTVKLPADNNTVAGLIVGASNTATANATSTNGNTYLNLLNDGKTVTSYAHLIKGTGITTVTSDANGVISINTTAPSVTHPNAFGKVMAGSTTLSSTTTNDTLTVSGGTNISVSGSGKTVTISTSATADAEIPVGTTSSTASEQSVIGALLATGILSSASDATIY